MEKERVRSLKTVGNVQRSYKCNAFSRIARLFLFIYQSIFIWRLLSGFPSRSCRFGGFDVITGRIGNQHKLLSKINHGRMMKVYSYLYCYMRLAQDTFVTGNREDLQALWGHLHTGYFRSKVNRQLVTPRIAIITNVDSSQKHRRQIKVKRSHRHWLQKEIEFRNLLWLHHFHLKWKSFVMKHKASSSYKSIV